MIVVNLIEEIKYCAFIFRPNCKLHGHEENKILKEEIDLYRKKFKYDPIASDDPFLEPNVSHQKRPVTAFRASSPLDSVDPCRLSNGVSFQFE